MKLNYDIVTGGGTVNISKTDNLSVGLAELNSKDPV